MSHHWKKGGCSLSVGLYREDFCPLSGRHKRRISSVTVMNCTDALLKRWKMYSSWFFGGGLRPNLGKVIQLFSISLRWFQSISSCDFVPIVFICAVHWFKKRLEMGCLEFILRPFKKKYTQSWTSSNITSQQHLTSSWTDSLEPSLYIFLWYVAPEHSWIWLWPVTSLYWSLIAVRSSFASTAVPTY